MLVYEAFHTLVIISLIPTDFENLLLHYAMTLDAWGIRFEANVDQIEAMYDPSFIRMWRMFLNGSAASFRYGDLRLYQISFTNGINNALPLTREHLYWPQQSHIEIHSNLEKSYRTE